MKVNAVQEMEVFKLSHKLAIRIYKLTKNFPSEEQFGLVSQMRRASYSIPMNLAEGGGRLNRKEYRQFVGIARGSVSEINYQILLARDLSLISKEIYKNLRKEYISVNRMLTKLAKSLT